jgi:hypothetical protein
LVADPNRHPGGVGQSYPRKPRPVPILVVETPRDVEHIDTAAGKPVAAGGWYIFAVVLFFVIASIPALWNWIGGAK